MKRNGIFVKFILTIAIIANLLPTAFAENNTAELVATAEVSRVQADIDAAQIAVSQLSDGSDKTEYMARLDNLQAKVDAYVYIDQSSNRFFGAESIETDSVVGNYAVVDCTERVNLSSNIDSLSLVGNSFKIEQKIKFDHIDSDKYLYMYTDVGQLWALNSNSGSIMGSKWASWATGNLTAGKWYNVVFEYDGENAKAGETKYHTLSVIDVETNTVVSRRTDKVEILDYAGVSHDSIGKFQYVFDQYGSDSSKVYVGDLIVTEVTDVKTARAAVVKAERSKSVNDIWDAESLVSVLDADADKTALEKRVEALKVDMNDEDYAQKFVTVAEESEAQADIDAAQIYVSSISDGDARRAFEKRLDNLQAKVDAYVYIDQSSNRFFGAESIETDSVVGNYAVVDCTERVNLSSNIDSLSLVGNSFKIEQKIKFDHIDSDKYLYMYTDVGQLWALNSNSGSIMGSKWASWATGNLTAGKWYNVVFEYDGENAKAGETKYHTLSVIDVETNTVVSRRTDKVEILDYAGVSHDSIGKLQYVFDQYGSDSSKVYIGDLIVTEVTAVKTARAAVVKAERSKASDDIWEAEAIVAALEADADKTALEARVQALIAGMTEEDVAQKYIKKAEESKAQADIDAAQIFVSNMSVSDERTALEKRIDALQLSVDSEVYVDFEDRIVGPTTDNFSNNVTTSYIEDNGNIYAELALKDSNTGGWGPEYTFNKALATGDFYVEQKFSYVGTIEYGEIKVYATPNAKLLFNVFSDGRIGTEVESWQVPVSGVSYTSGVWYKVRYSYNSTENSATISVVDLSNNTVVASSKVQYANPVAYSDWEKVQYQFGGLTNDGTGKILIDDLVVACQTPVMNARAAVVKAERSKAANDIWTAEAIVAELEDSEEKAVLEERVEALKADITDEDIAQKYVMTAENSKAQADVDAAQIFVASIDGDATAFENRLDKLQKELDAVIYTDYEVREENSAYIAGNTATGTIVTENGNKVAKVQLKETSNGGFAERVYVKEGTAIGNNFTVEQKVKYSGNMENGRISLYAFGDGVADHLFNVEVSTNQVKNSGGGGTQENTLSADKWYNVIFSVNADKYKITVIDDATDSIVYDGYEMEFKADESKWTNLSHLFEGSTADGTGALYIDDLVVVNNTAVTNARNLVVKAERSKMTADVAAAEEAVALIEDAAEKTAFINRLNNIAVTDAMSIEYELTNENGEVIQEAVAGKLNVAVKVKTPVAIPVRVAVAVYTVENGITRFNSAYLGNQETVDGEMKLEVSSVNVPDNAIVKIMVLDSIETMNPYCQVKEF